MKKQIYALLLICCCLTSALQLFSATQIKKLPIVHAHRGGAALYPENTIPAMLHAVEIGVPMLELDLHVTRDSQVVVSHDAYMNPIKALKPNGEEIPIDSARMYSIYSMTYDSLKRYDVGSRPNPAFPNRKNLKCSVPLVSDLIDSVEHSTQSKGLCPVGYNIEIKSWPDKDGIYSPDYRTFADLCMRVLLSKNLGDRLLLQCFDPRTLNYVHEKYPNVRLSYLVEDMTVDFDELMKRINFVPQVISPNHAMVDSAFMDKSRKLGMEVAPWTVDEKDEILRLRTLGVDAIITNRPDSVMTWLKDLP
jgi:glycerophosphoryl diester phosphodiesterase